MVTIIFFIRKYDDDDDDDSDDNDNYKDATYNVISCKSHNSRSREHVFDPQLVDSHTDA